MNSLPVNIIAPSSDAGSANAKAKPSADGADSERSFSSYLDNASSAAEATNQRASETTESVNPETHEVDLESAVLIVEPFAAPIEPSTTTVDAAFTKSSAFVDPSASELSTSTLVTGNSQINIFDPNSVNDVVQISPQTSPNQNDLSSELVDHTGEQLELGQETAETIATQTSSEKFSSGLSSELAANEAVDVVYTTTQTPSELNQPESELQVVNEETTTSTVSSSLETGFGSEQGFGSAQQQFASYEQADSTLNVAVAESETASQNFSVSAMEEPVHTRYSSEPMWKSVGQPVSSMDTGSVVAPEGRQSILAPPKDVAMQVAAVFTSGLTSLDKEPVQTISLELHPAELGHLKIRVEQTADQLIAHIIASEQASSDLLQQEKSFLLESLAELGFGETSLDISQGDPGQSDAEKEEFLPHQKIKELDLEIKSESPVPPVLGTGSVNFIA